MIYYDNAATTRCHAEVADLVVKYMTMQYGNTASLHRMGLDAEKALKNSRGLIAKHLRCLPEQLVFTSGGSESNNWIVQRVMEGVAGHIVVSSIEHPSVLEVVKAMATKGWQVTYVPVNKAGIVQIADILKVVQVNTKLVSVMLVNNETGALQPIEKMVKALRNSGYTGLIHTDATQAVGKVKINIVQLGVDFLSLSAHKCHGPKGVGLLYQKQHNVLKPLMYGGGQEANQRSGTHNLPGIVGMAKAIAMADESIQKNWDAAHKLRKLLLDSLSSIPYALLPTCEISPYADQSPPEDKTNWAVPHILSIAIKNAKSEVVLHALEQRGIMISSGSACSSTKKAAVSHVIQAMGLEPAYADGVIRLSFSCYNTIEEGVAAATEILAVLKSLQFTRER